MKKVIRLTENDLVKLVKRVISEQKNVAAMAKIVQELSKSNCASLNISMRDIITKLMLGTDYQTYKTKATWGEFYTLLQDTKKKLDAEIGKPGKSQVSLSIQNLGKNVDSACVKNFQELLVSQAGLPDVLDTPDGGRVQFIDGIVGLTTLVAYVDGALDFFTKVLQTNPDRKNEPLVAITGTKSAASFEKTVPVKQSTQSIQR
jgi:hypothetical protein